MVMLIGIGNAKSQNNFIQKPRLRQGMAGSGKVVPGMKDKLIDADCQIGAFQQRVVTAAVRIGPRAFDKRPLAVRD